MSARFGYYDNLTRRQQRIYDASDAIAEVALTAVEPMRPAVARIRDALASGKRGPMRAACQDLADALADDLEVPRLTVRVLAVRPRNRDTELHGVYERIEGESARIDLWMRTAAQKKVVAYRTFLRTLLHEFCHHLDYERLRLADSFHTQGFFQRESSLFRQLNAD